MRVPARRSPSTSHAQCSLELPPVPRGYPGGEAHGAGGQHGSGSILGQCDRPAPCLLREVSWYETRFEHGELVEQRHVALVPEGDGPRVVPIGDADLIVNARYF